MRGFLADLFHRKSSTEEIIEPQQEADIPDRGADAAAPAGTVASVPDVAEIQEAIDEVARMWKKAGDIVAPEYVGGGVSYGELTVSQKGWELEAATVRVGEMIAARADARIAGGMSAIRAEYGIADDVDLSVVTVPEEMSILRVKDAELVLQDLARFDEDDLTYGDVVKSIHEMKERVLHSIAARRLLIMQGVNVEELQTRIARMRADAYLASLAEVRELGTPDMVSFTAAPYSFRGTPPPESEYTGKRPYESVMNDFHAARRRYGDEVAALTPEAAIDVSAGLFPADWWRQSNDSHLSLSVHVGEDDSSYMPVTGRITVHYSPESFYSGAAHELSHRMEKTVTRQVAGETTYPIVELEEIFLRRRTNRGPDAKTVGDVPIKMNGGAATMYPDNFAHFYIGRDYDAMYKRRPTGKEVLSVAMESLFYGTTGGLVGDGGYRADLDHRAFTLGVLATVGRKPAKRKGWLSR